MAKLTKTQPQDLLNLQSGDYAHFVHDGIAVNDVTTFEPRHHVNNIHKTSDTKAFRLVLNVVFSLAIFAAALITGFYPISLLVFLSLYDLRSLNRSNLPINKSGFIPYDNIEKVKMIKGLLGFNYAHIIIVDDNGNKSLKKLKLYDSQSGWDRAIVLFTRIGKLSIEDVPQKDLSKLQKVTVGNGVEYAIEDDCLNLIENNKYKEEREDPYKYFRFVALTGFIGTLGAVVAKFDEMMSVYKSSSFFKAFKHVFVNYQYHLVDYFVVVFFILVSLIPLRYVRKARPTIINKSEVKEFEVTKKNFIIKLNGWKGFTLIVKHDLKYFTPEGIDNLKKFLSK